MIFLQYQTTLAKAVSFNGVGLYSGREVKLRLRPAPADTGIVFIRTDLPELPRLRAAAANVTSTVRATTVEENGVKVFTIEHLMSALHMQRVDNCFIEMNSEEPPVADGSGRVFFEMIDEAGIVRQDAPRHEVVVDRVYRVDDGNKFIMALPYDGFRVTFTSLNPHPLVGTQYFDFVDEGDCYRNEIVGARTIAYDKEVEALQKMGLGLGGTLENVIVYSDTGWLNELRYPDELVRHKILDAVGDMRLAGIVRGHIIAVASSHALNTRLAKLLATALHA